MSSLVVPDQQLQPVDWKTIDSAIFCWATEKLNFSGLWENQSAPQPPYPYLSFFRQGESDEGGIDETRQQTIATDGSVMKPGSSKTPLENEEIVYQPISFAVTIQAHVDFDAGATESGGEAQRLLGILKRSLFQTTTIQLFKDAGLSVVEPQDIQDLSLLINGDWVSRAALDVIFRTAAVMTERVGFIEKVELKSEQLGVDTIVDAS